MAADRNGQGLVANMRLRAREFFFLMLDWWHESTADQIIVDLIIVFGMVAVIVSVLWR